jgi:ABC-type uncharacterized transport system permease subunit
MILTFGSAGSPGQWALARARAAACIGYLTAALAPERLQRGLGAAVVIAWVLHAVAIGIDSSGLGTASGAARFGFAPALSATLWLVIAVYLVETRFVPLPNVRRTLAVLGVVAVALAWLFPGEVRPQLASRWAPLHWVMGIASYGLFGAAVLHAALMNRADRRMRLQQGGPQAPGGASSAGMPLLRLERLTFRFVGAGFAVLTAALVLGWWNAQPWRWDHKTVFSMLGWLVFAALLAGRRAFGWRGRRATRWVYAGVGLLLLAYVGSRFVIEVVLQRAA